MEIYIAVVFDDNLKAHMYSTDSGPSIYTNFASWTSENRLNCKNPIGSAKSTGPNFPMEPKIGPAVENLLGDLSDFGLEFANLRS